VSQKPRILFQLSGSIACYKACQVISRLVQEGFEVQTIRTANTSNFIGDATLEGLSGRPVCHDVYEKGRMLGHIELAKWADMAILCPATAHTINRLAAGMGDDAVGATFLAFNLKNKPYLIAPAMNHEMFRHPSTVESLNKLQSWGAQVLPTDHGYQACGDIAQGRLLDPDAIYKHVIEAHRRKLS
jgi:phosphopantothenoylcysteine synthetase/decarboxylase